MKFAMKMPFTVVPGARECFGFTNWYTATVVDKDGRYVGIDGCKGRSAVSQDDANEAAIRNARAWAQRVRLHAGLR